MSYYYDMNQRDSSLRLPWYRMEDATEAIQPLAESMGLVGDKSAKLVDVLTEAEWASEYDHQGSLVSLTWEGGYLEVAERQGEVPEPPYVLTLLAPFIQEGSFLEFSSEEASELVDAGEAWRWVFRNKSVETIRPVLTWPM